MHYTHYTAKHNLCFRILILNRKMVFKVNYLFPFGKIVRGLCRTRIVHSKWDLLTAVCVERKPVITPLLNELDQKFQSLLSEVEYENSFKADHEIRHEQDLKQQEQIKKGESDVDILIKETAQDFLDASNELLSKFKCGERFTTDDEVNNTKSLHRKLDKHLVLLTKHKLGDKELYLIPQGKHQEGETLRQAAERIMKDSCGDEMKVQFYGNAPCGFYKFTYPENIKKENGTVGAKIFIYFARYTSGGLTMNRDFKWLDRIELQKELPPKYYNSIDSFLIEETDN
ncbi:hypothetical protein FQA39_LY17488 [Lamprigera yunnana]|nr:hypothetical protein FQA39_LY17488 [Lamprigera yunnana]